MTTLVLTTRLFDTPRSGGEHCSARLWDHLRDLGHALHVVGRGPVPCTQSMHTESLGPAVIPQSTLTAPERLCSFTAALWRRRAWTVHRTLAQGAAQRARAVLQAALTDAVDLIVVDHLLAWSWIEVLPAAQRARLPPILLLMHNLESQIYRQPAQGAPTPPVLRRLIAREERLVAGMEQRALNESAAVVCLSEADAQALRSQAPAERHIAVLPGHGPLRAASTPRRPAPARTRRVGLMGTWSWAPNRRGLEWLLSEVLPHLPDDTELVLAGLGLPALPDHPQLRVLGVVADVEAFYAQIDVIALAAVDGSGVQEKAIEALSRPHPVVATRCALRGLAPWPAGVSVADDAAEFAHACATLPLTDRSADAIQAWNGARARHYRIALQRALAVARSQESR